MQQNEITIGGPDLNLGTYGVVQQEVELGVRALGLQHADAAVTFFTSALRKLTSGQPFYDHLVHNLLLSYKLSVEQLLRSGQSDAAVNVLQDALALEIRGEMADDATFRKEFAGAYQGLGLALFSNGRFGESVLAFRKSIRVRQAPGFHINLSNALTASGVRAELLDFTADISPEQLGQHIFIACVPKSASTFLKNLLVSLTGYRDVFMVYAAGQSEHELYLPTLRDTGHFDTVTQQHCRASDANVQMMQAFNIRPLVLVRNIFDSVMSLLDFYDKGAFYQSYFRTDYESLDEESRIDLIIDNVIPWYFQFVASWALVEKQQRLEILWLSYEDLIKDKPKAIENILAFYGLGASRRNVQERITEIESGKTKIRFNRGVAGRGKSGLSERQKDRVRQMTRYYPSTDFGRIGL